MSRYQTSLLRGVPPMTYSFLMNTVAACQARGGQGAFPQYLLQCDFSKIIFVLAYAQVTPSSVIHMSFEGWGAYPPRSIMMSSTPSLLRSKGVNECPNRTYLYEIKLRLREEQLVTKELWDPAGQRPHSEHNSLRVD